MYNSTRSRVLVPRVALFGSLNSMRWADASGRRGKELSDWEIAANLLSKGEGWGISFRLGGLVTMAQARMKIREIQKVFY